MKKNLKGFVLGVIVTTILMSTALGAQVKKTIEVVYNSVNITVNGTKVDTDNLLYKGTTYVPLRAVSEMLGKDVEWDGKTGTASINDKGAATKPSETNYSRTNPGPIGVKQVVTVESILDKYTAEITITEAIRGDEAWRLIKSANMFNKEPAADEEYILAKIKIKVLDVKDDKKVDINSYSFDLYNSNNVEYDTRSVVDPEPSLGTSLYAGGEHEGYASYLVKKSDTNPKLVYGQKYDGTGGIWFKLNK